MTAALHFCSAKVQQAGSVSLLRTQPANCSNLAVALKSIFGPYASFIFEFSGKKFDSFLAVLAELHLITLETAEFSARNEMIFVSINLMNEGGMA